jgi:hypothetical protein
VRSLVAVHSMPGICRPKCEKRVFRRSLDGTALCDRPGDDRTEADSPGLTPCGRRSIVRAILHAPARHWGLSGRPSGRPSGNGSTSQKGWTLRCTEMTKSNVVRFAARSSCHPSFGCFGTDTSRSESSPVGIPQQRNLNQCLACQATLD